MKLKIRCGFCGEILDTLKQKPLGARFLEDYNFRTILTTLLGFLLNVVYTIYNGVLGIVSASPWFIIMAVYYGLLMMMRYQAVSTQRKISQMKDPEQIQKKQLAVLRTDGILLLVLNLALSGVVLLTIAKDTAKKYSDVIVITIAVIGIRMIYQAGKKKGHGEP